MKNTDYGSSKYTACATQRRECHATKPNLYPGVFITVTSENSLKQLKK